LFKLVAMAILEASSAKRQKKRHQGRLPGATLTATFGTSHELRA